MKIGINAKFLRKPGTGIGRVTAELLAQFSQVKSPKLLPTGQAGEVQNAEIFLYCEESPALPFALPPNWHIRVIRSWYGRDDLVREHWWERFTLPRAIKKDGCDVFLSLYQSATVLPPSIRHVMFVHDLVSLHFPEYLGTWRKRVHYRRVLSAIRSADHIIAPSRATADDLHDQLNIAPERLTVVPLGLSLRFQTPASADIVDAILRKYGLERGYIYHGGGLEKRKNTGALLEAYAEMVKGDNSVPPLVISGMIHTKRNPLATDIRGFIEKLGLGRRVKLLGFVPDEDVPGLYAGALCFVYPSLFEGFGLPVLEALSQGTPVLASRASSLPEVAGEVALFFDPSRPADLREQLTALIHDATLRDRLAQAGPIQARRFSWSHATEALNRILVQ